MSLSPRVILSVADLIDKTRFPKSDYIEHLYRVMLLREPDPNGSKSYLHREDTNKFLLEMISCSEFKEIFQDTA